MKKMKKERIREILENLCDMVEFLYNEKWGDVEKFYFPEEERHEYQLFYDGYMVRVDSLDEAMETPFIDGKSFNEIAKELKFYSGSERLY